MSLSCLVNNNNNNNDDDYDDDYDDDDDDYDDDADDDWLIGLPLLSNPRFCHLWTHSC